MGKVDRNRTEARINDDGGAAERAAEAERKRAEEAERKRKEEEARRVAKEEATKVASKMEEAKKMERVVRKSVAFEAAVKKMPKQVLRQSVKFSLTKERADKVKTLGAAEAAKDAGVIASSWAKAVKTLDVAKMEAIALPRIEKAAGKAADLVDKIQGAAATLAKVAVKDNLGVAAGAAAQVMKVIDSEGLEGKAKWGAEGIREMMPKLAAQLADTAGWAKEGLDLGDLKATAIGVRKQLADVRDTVSVLHEANGVLAKAAGAAWNGGAIEKALHGIEKAAQHTDVAMGLAQGRAQFAVDHAVGQVNAARARGGYERIAKDAGPEAWMPADGEKPKASHLPKSDDSATEVGRLAGKLEELKARKAAGENVDEAMHSVKANLKAAEKVLESGATSMSGGAAPAEGVEGAEELQLPPGVTMGPDGVPVDADGMPLGLSDEDIAKIGTGVPKDGGPQVMWTRNDGFPEDRQPGALPSQFAGKAREQGLVTPEQVKTSQDLANKSVGEETRKFEVGDVALLAKQAGIPLEKMDANQLSQAAKLLNSGKTPQEQRDCISVAVQNLQMIAGGKPPEFKRDEMKALMWAQSKLPAHALDKVKDGELSKKFQESIAATNTPGEHSFKIGKYNTTIKVSDDGAFESSKCKKPSLLSKIVKVAKIVTKVAAVIPGPWQPFAIAGCAAMAAYDAIKAKSLFGVVTAVASVCGPVGMTISRVATGIKSVADGIKTWKSGGSFLGGLASVAGGVAGALGAKLGAWGERLQNFSKGVGAADGIIQANKQVGKMKEELEKARASGDPAAIADAMKNLETAERGKKGAILGAGAAALTMAGGTKGKGEDGARTAFQQAMKLGAGALNVGKGVVTKDYAGAMADGLQLAADVRQGTKAPAMVTADGKNGQPGARVERFGLGALATSVRGVNALVQADKAEGIAKQNVEQAQSELQQARNSKDPEWIKAAEEGLKKAKGEANSAASKSWDAYYENRDAAMTAVTSFNATRQNDTRVAVTWENTKTSTTERGQFLTGLTAGDRPADVKQLAADNEAKLADLNSQMAAAAQRGDKAELSRLQEKVEQQSAVGTKNVIVGVGKDSAQKADAEIGKNNEYLKNGVRVGIDGKPVPIGAMMTESTQNMTRAVSDANVELSNLLKAKNPDPEKILAALNDVDFAVRQGLTLKGNAEFKQEVLDRHQAALSGLQRLREDFNAGKVPPAKLEAERQRLERVLTGVTDAADRIYTGTSFDPKQLGEQRAALEQRADALSAKARAPGATPADEAAAAAARAEFSRFGMRTPENLAAVDGAFRRFDTAKQDSRNYIDVVKSNIELDERIDADAKKDPRLQTAAAKADAKVQTAEAAYQRALQNGGDLEAARADVLKARGEATKGYNAVAEQVNAEAREKAIAKAKADAAAADKASPAGRAEAQLEAALAAQKAAPGNAMTGIKVRELQAQVAGDLQKTTDALKNDKLTAPQRAELLAQKIRLESARAQATLMDPIIANHVAENARGASDGLNPAIKNQILTQEQALKNQFNDANAKVDADTRALADLYAKTANDPKASPEERAWAKANLKAVNDGLAAGDKQRTETINQDLGKLAERYGGTMNKSGMGTGMADVLGIDVSGMKGSAKSEFEILQGHYKQYSAKGYLTEKERQLIDQQITNLHLRLGDVDEHRKAAVNWVKDTGTSVVVAGVGFATAGAGLVVAGAIGAAAGASTRAGIGYAAEGDDYTGRQLAQDLARGGAEGLGNGLGLGTLGAARKAAQAGINEAAKAAAKEGAKQGLGRTVLNGAGRGAVEGLVGSVGGNALITASDFDTWKDGVGAGLQRIQDGVAQTVTTPEGLMGVGIGAAMGGLGGLKGSRFDVNLGGRGGTPNAPRIDGTPRAGGPDVRPIDGPPAGAPQARAAEGTQARQTLENSITQRGADRPPAEARADAARTHLQGRGVELAPPAGDGRVVISPDGNHPLNRLARGMQEKYGTELSYDPASLDKHGAGAYFESSAGGKRINMGDRAVLDADGATPELTHELRHMHNDSTTATSMQGDEAIAYANQQRAAAMQGRERLRQLQDPNLTPDQARALAEQIKKDVAEAATSGGRSTDMANWERGRLDSAQKVLDGDFVPGKDVKLKGTKERPVLEVSRPGQEPIDVALLPNTRVDMSNPAEVRAAAKKAADFERRRLDATTASTRQASRDLRAVNERLAAAEDPVAFLRNPENAQALNGAFESARAKPGATGDGLRGARARGEVNGGGDAGRVRYSDGPEVRGRGETLTPSEAFARDFAAHDFETGNARSRAKAAELKPEALRVGQMREGFGADDVASALGNRRITDKDGNSYSLATASDGGRVRIEIRTASGEVAGIANRVVSTPGELGIGGIELKPSFQNKGLGQGLYKALADVSPPGTKFQLNVTEASTAAKVGKWYENARAKGMSHEMAVDKVGQLFGSTPWGKILQKSGWKVDGIDVMNGEPQITVVKPGLASDAIGALKAPKRAVLPNEGILIGPEHGLQSRTSGRFDGVMMGRHGDAKTKYLWTIDERGVNVVHELTAFPTPRKNVVHTNLSPQAAIGGEAWFGPDNTVVINAGSGRFGDAAGITEPQWNSAVNYWESLGYKVKPQPYGTR